MSAIKESIPISKEVGLSMNGIDCNINSLRSLFENLFNIPTEMIRLIIFQTLGWLAFFSTHLFFTDFVAQVLSYY